MGLYFYTILTVGSIGLIAAVLLYLVAQKFKVEADPRIEEILAVLPSANCGGCGLPGCNAFAEAITKAHDLKTLFCPVGGNVSMGKAAQIMGLVAEQHAPKVAVVRCNGTHTNRPRLTVYNGARSCAIENTLYMGETGCAYGCLGCGDCTSVCLFNAITMDNTLGIPVVDEDKCTECSACVKACPRNIIELRKKAPKNRKILVTCVNKERGVIARKSCTAACIACGKCQKVCQHNAIVIENNLAFIDSNECKLCRKCVSECPTGAITEHNFPARKTIPLSLIDNELVLN